MIGALVAGCPPPGCPFDEPCAPNEVRQCLNYCVPVATEAEIEARIARCALDPCAAELYEEPNVFACPTAARCADAGDTGEPEFGRCVSTLAGGDACGGVGEDSLPCPTGSFCMSHELCPGRAGTLSQVTGVTPGDEPGYCLPFTQENQRCDSNARAAGDGAFANGCSPCTPGTFCSDAGRCIRLCEDDGRAPNADLCSCVGSQCIVGQVTDPETGERREGAFCTPCSENAHACESNDECCREGASCEQELDPITLRDSRCCFAEGADCRDNRDCCLGNLCDPGTGRCESCGREGEDGTQQACCAGYESRVIGRDIVCQACGFLDDLEHLCNPDEYVNLQSVQGRWETALIPEGDRAWRDNVGHTAGRFDVTREQLSQVVYRLSDDRRAFLFQNSVDRAGGIPIGRTYAELRQSAGVEVAESLADPGPWRSLRVYDVGECSLHLTWPEFTNILAGEVNKILIRDGEEDFGSVWDDIVGHAETTVTPRIRAESRYPSRFQMGPENSLDFIDVDYGLDIADRCADRVRTKVRIRPSVEPASDGGIRNAAGEDSDEVMSQVRCDVPAEDDDVYRCFFPAPEGAAYRLNEREVERRRFDTIATRDCAIDCSVGTGECGGADDCGFCCAARFPNSALATNDRRAARVGCVQTYDEYRCVGLRGYDDDAEPPFHDELRTLDRRFDRTPNFLPGGSELILRVELVDFEIDGGWFCEAIGEVILNEREEQVEIALWEGLSDLSALLGDILGTNVTDDFRSTPRTCRNTADCRPAYGNYRTECVRGLCDETTIEPRRIALRPDGIDIVLAESPTDPQYDLVSRRLLADQLCSGVRRRGNSPDDLATPTLIESTTPTDFSGAFCDPDDVAQCDGICLETGAPCGDTNSLLFLRYPLQFGPSDRCFAGECCRPIEVCEGQCRDYNSDAAHCGGCGDPCGEGEACGSGECCPPEDICGIRCVDRQSDAQNCGACGVVCGDGETCSAGSCCAGAVCDGGCTDLQNDPSNCGECGEVCADGASCIDGACCDGLDCEGVCTPRDDPMNCGGCGVICAEGNTCCASGCRDLSDSLNCGACGRRCARGETCLFGRTCARL